MMPEDLRGATDRPEVEPDPRLQLEMGSVRTAAWDRLVALLARRMAERYERRHAS